MPAASILSGVVSVKVLCIRLVDLRSHGATIISHSLTPPPVSIRFNDRTSFAETTNSKKDIPTELFRFRSYEHWLIRTDNYHLKRELMYLSIVIGTGCS
ncbi:hypothetical protein Bca4012_004111 [Brassica carinata]